MPKPASRTKSYRENLLESLDASGPTGMAGRWTYSEPQVRAYREHNEIPERSPYGSCARSAQWCPNVGQ